MAQMQELLAKSYRDFREGSIVKGRVLEIRPREVLVDIGYKSEGVIPSAEFDNIDTLEVGDEVDVLLERLENDEGMGADYYELSSERTADEIPIGIGRNCVIDRAIIDKNARIADGVVITPEGKPENFDAENYYIRDAIVVIPKNAAIPPGFWI